MTAFPAEKKDPAIEETIKTITDAVMRTVSAELKKLATENAALKKRLKPFEKPTAKMTLSNGKVIETYQIEKDA